jgi:hypothetical protein
VEFDERHHPHPRWLTGIVSPACRRPSPALWWDLGSAAAPLPLLDASASAVRVGLPPDNRARLACDRRLRRRRVVVAHDRSLSQRATGCVHKSVYSTVSHQRDYTQRHSALHCVCCRIFLYGIKAARSARRWPGSPAAPLPAARPLAQRLMIHGGCRACNGQCWCGPAGGGRSA